MRAIIVTLFAVLFFTIASGAKATVLDYNTYSVEQDAKTVTIKINSFEQSSICGMRVSEMTIQKPADVYPSRILSLGLISLKFERLNNQVCLKATGIEKAKIVLTKGVDLPAIAEGESYIVEINEFEVSENLYVK